MVTAVSSTNPVVKPKSVALCHFCTVPTKPPPKVNTVGEPPVQIVWSPLTLPPTEAALTVIIAAVEFAAVQLPL